MLSINKMHRPLAFAAALFVTAAPSFAQDTAADAGTEAETDMAAAAEVGMSPEFVRAYDVAMARINETLSHDQMAEINLLAYAAAAAGLCVDLALDEPAVYGALTESSHDSLDGLSEEEAQVHRDFSLIAFGVMTGLILESAASSEADFCAEAVEYATEMGADAFLEQVGSAVLYGDATE